jgi:uncharacterized protein
MLQNKRKILSLDGGGIKGVFAAAFLETIEEATGKRIAEYFDLIAGTSTGGIIAIGLGLGMSAKEISQFYFDYGPYIFNQNNPLNKLGYLEKAKALISNIIDSKRHIIFPKYDARELRKALEQAFESRQLGESKVRLIIPAYHADKEDVYIFKTRHHSRLKIDWKESVVNVALATAAAPTYFQAHNMPNGAPLIDGGIWANNPVGLAAVEARSVLGWKDDDLFIVRLGCTEETIDIPIDKGISGFLLKSTALLMQGQSRGSDGIAMLLSNHRQENPRFFPFQPKAPSGKYGLDNVEMINRLRGLGSAYGRDALPLFEKHFLNTKTEPFVPLNDSAV